MLAPEKYVNLKLSVVSVSSFMLAILMKEHTVKYDELLSKVIDAKGADARTNFLPSLNFLFVLGKLDYEQDLDAISLI